MSADALRPLSALFAAPALLLVGLAAAALAGAVLRLAARRATRVRESLVSPALAARTSPRRRNLRDGAAAVLVVLTVLGLFAALARPRWGGTTEKAERRGADVVIVLDTSASMRAADVIPSRFVLARQAATSLVGELPGDRVALVACEGEAQTLVPLTLDTAAAGMFLDALEPGIGTKPGTSLAAGLAAAAELFPAGSATGRNCVVISDGEDLEGGVDKAIGRAKENGIVVHTVLVGAVGGKGAPVPEVDVAGRAVGYKTDASGAPVLSRPDPDLLRKLAAETGGTFSVVSPGRTDLSAVARRIDLTARRPLAEVLVTSLEERFQIPLGVAVVALGLLLLGAANARLPRRRREGATALLFTALLSLPAHAQQPATAAPAPAAAPEPDPTPLPALERLLGSARGEAKLGKKAMDEKRYDDAAAHFRRESEIKPSDPIGPYNLGSALGKAGKTQEAVASLDTARRTSTGAVAADAAFNTGTTLLRGGDYERAASAFRDALRLRPGDADASYNYELCTRKAEEQKKQQQQQQQQQKRNDDTGNEKKKPQGGAPAPTPSPQGGGGDDAMKKQQQQDREFESKAKMSREKAEQLLAAVERSDLDEQRKKIAERKAKRKTGKDW
jgi:Ca-activated chloride channel family protein